MSTWLLRTKVRAINVHCKHEETEKELGHAHTCTIAVIEQDLAYECIVAAYQGKNDCLTLFFKLLRT